MIPILKICSIFDGFPEFVICYEFDVLVRAKRETNFLKNERKIIVIFWCWRRVQINDKNAIFYIRVVDGVPSGTHAFIRIDHEDEY